LRPFYEKLYYLLKKNQYLPFNIFNYDETSLRTDAKSGKKVVTSITIEKTFVKEIKSLTSTTVGLCVSAIGSSLPPLLILQDGVVIDEESCLLLRRGDMIIKTSRKGWITRDIFTFYMQYVVLPAIVARLEMKFQTFFID
jgi:hypothetical protein